MSDFVEIIEVSPRDGLQNESVVLSVEDRLHLIALAATAGLRRIEVASFVNPKRVPQMAHAEQMIAGLVSMPEVSGIGLVLNPKGFERAREAGCREINAVIVASETFSAKNQGATIAESTENWLQIASAAKEAGIRTSLTIAASFGCPFEGEIHPAAVASIVEAALATPPDELAFADTIGCGVPTQVRAILSAVRPTTGDVPLRFHFHDTRNTGIANVVAAVEQGVLRFDASIGGTGGCPFAPAATGNVATEDVAYLLQRMGFRTGLDLDRLSEATMWLTEALGHALPAALSRAGPFPRTD